jgi:hypothetical protein
MLIRFLDFYNLFIFILVTIGLLRRVPKYNPVPNKNILNINIKDIIKGISYTKLKILLKFKNFSKGD